MLTFAAANRSFHHYERGVFRNEARTFSQFFVSSIVELAQTAPNYSETDIHLIHKSCGQDVHKVRKSAVHRVQRNKTKLRTRE